MGERAKFWNARAFKRRRTVFKKKMNVFKKDVFRISIDYILELLARFARSPIKSYNLSQLSAKILEGQTFDVQRNWQLNWAVFSKTIELEIEKT